MKETRKVQQFEVLNQIHIVNQGDLGNLKDELESLCEIPDDLKCIITHDLLKHPVISCHGHCYSKEPILEWLNKKSVCPLTGEPLYENDLIADQTIQKLVNDFTQDRNSTLAAITRIKSMVEETTIRQTVKEYKDREAEKIKQLATLKELIFKKNKLIERLKININNLKHLEFWHNQTNHCWHGKGGAKIIHPETQNIFRIPTHIANMVRIASNKDAYTTQESFLQALDRARKATSRNPFALFMRKEVTKSVYLAPKLSQVNLSQVNR
jgi:U-box domain